MVSSAACGLTQEVLAEQSQPAHSNSNGVPENAQLIEELGTDGLKVYGRDDTLWLHLESAAKERKTITIPRLCAPMRSFGWKEHPDAELKFVPEPREWTFSWKTLPEDSDVIEVVFDSAPLLPDKLPPARSAGDGSVMLHAFQASAHGEKLRFEPQPFKNTVGYWIVPTDYVTWQVTIDQPGTFSVAVLQGCGQGQGGSEGAITLRQHEDVKADLAFQTLDTGHFQNFRWNDLGMITLAAEGDYQLRIQPQRIAKAALFDVRAVHLVRQAT